LISFELDLTMSSFRDGLSSSDWYFLLEMSKIQNITFRCSIDSFLDHEISLSSNEFMWHSNDRTSDLIPLEFLSILNPIADTFTSLGLDWKIYFDV
jgi:hypothetical protein